MQYAIFRPSNLVVMPTVLCAVAQQLLGIGISVGSNNRSSHVICVRITSNSLLVISLTDKRD